MGVIKNPTEVGFQINRKGLILLGLVGTTRAVHAKRIRKSKAITFTSFISHVTTIKITIHACRHWASYEVLHTIGHVRLQEPSIGIGQVVVNGVALWDRTVILDGVDVVVRGTNTQLRLKEAGSNELEIRRNNEFQRAGCDQQTTFICPLSDLDDCVFQSRFVQVGSQFRSGR